VPITTNIVSLNPDIVCVVFFALFCFVLCDLHCHFLWIVHFWLPLRCSLKFVFYRMHTVFLYKLHVQLSGDLIISECTVGLGGYWEHHQQYTRGRRGRDPMIVGFITTYAISAYHHWCIPFLCNSHPVMTDIGQHSTMVQSTVSYVLCILRLVDNH
jgi:hypothetical protein